MNAKTGDTVTLPNGLSYVVVKEGEGTLPNRGERVRVHYTGTLENGTKFDSSRDRGDPFEFTVGVGQVIKGWDIGVALMKPGAIYKFTIPADLAYGNRAVGGVIPANSTLLFEVERLP